MVRSLAGDLGEGKLSRRRTFRDPHHSATLQALVGGGLRARPGEVSLAHHGVLFLDELPEFNRATLEALRQPLESGRVTVARANAHVTYPARFQLVAAMNPCRCGHLMEPSRACGRAPRCGLDYQGKLSGPLLDRIDLCIDVPPVSAADLALPPPAETSADVAARVAAARAVQRERLEEFDRKGKLLAVEADETAGLLADRVRNWSKPRCNADTDGARARGHRRARRRGPRAAHARGRAARPVGPRLASHLAGGPHIGRSRRIGRRATPAHRRSLELSPAAAAADDGGVSRMGLPPRDVGLRRRLKRSGP